MTEDPANRGIYQIMTDSQYIYILLIYLDDIMQIMLGFLHMRICWNLSLDGKAVAHTKSNIDPDIIQIYT